MPRSMTGYGAARASGSRVAVEVEIRSVNARAFKLNARLSGQLAAKEADLEALVRRHLRRGTVALNVKLQRVRPQDAVRIRPEIVEGLARALEPLRKKGILEGGVTAEAILALPGAVETGVEEALRPADWKLVRDTVEEALGQLDSMRRREAKHLVKDLRSVVASMRRSLKAVLHRAPKVVAEARTRLEERVNSLLADAQHRIDDATLAREVALLADRSDVREETTRLAAHVDEFVEYLGTDDEIGRKLEFLAQEMLREVNTIGSKSNDVTLARSVIALKSDVDRLKEQVANLE
jgi:uncharacterized protein (TIGR00255 family)